MSATIGQLIVAIAVAGSVATMTARAAGRAFDRRWPPEKKEEE